MKIITRLKTFFWITLVWVGCFVGIFIPPLHKAMNEGALVASIKINKKLKVR